MSENELDQIKGMIAEFSHSGVLRLPYTERVVLGLEIAKMAPAMLAHIRALEAERDGLAVENEVLVQKINECWSAGIVKQDEYIARLRDVVANLKRLAGKEAG